MRKCFISVMKKTVFTLLAVLYGNETVICSITDITNKLHNLDANYLFGSVDMNNSIWRKISCYWKCGFYGTG